MRAASVCHGRDGTPCGISGPTAQRQCSLGQRPTAIKLRKSTLVPNLQIGNAIVCESPIRAALKEGSALRPAKDSVPGNPSLDRVRRWVVDGSRIRDSKTSAFPIRDWERERERACVSKGPRLNLMAVGRCPRLVRGWAVGPERRQAMSGSCPTITLALWRGQLLRMTAIGPPSSLGRLVFKVVGNGKRGLPHSKTLARSSKAPIGFIARPHRKGFFLRFDTRQRGIILTSSDV